MGSDRVCMGETTRARENGKRRKKERCQREREREREREKDRKREKERERGSVCVSEHLSCSRMCSISRAPSFFTLSLFLNFR